MSVKVNVNGSVCDVADATIPVMDHGFLFGDSVYETLRTYEGHFFRWDDHLTRLRASADALELRIPVSGEELRDRCIETMAAADEGDTAIRLVITRGVGPMDLDPSRCDAPNVLVFVRPRPRYAERAYRDGVAAAVVSRARNAVSSLDPNVKSGNYLNNVLALVEARKAGAFEPIMLNAHGHVTEGATSNVFAVISGVVTTPALSSGLLSGITRRTVLELCTRHGWPAAARELHVEDLRAAEEVFLTSALKQVMPVTRLDGLPVGWGRPGAVTLRMLAAYREAVREETGVQPSEDP